eukprot:gnl/TRDRNA2_/TRDRNA2_163652_c0_seq1.p1 gnl/TRDRNA2_/TRDRNA2_163652_c0~~gnl/TRDRNA2_/TRDRNA2_163652_c0_seq1.p1  ORF type:complete len:457 (-),score=59.91 gnl/TRDRNA2_/TRDRNA2_163652_c0_seq1:449-1819(-)
MLSLEKAALQGKAKVVADLLQRRCDPNTVNEHIGIPPLALAAKISSLECVGLLLQSRALVDMADAHGRTSLFHAMSSGNDECIRTLCLHGERQEWERKFPMVAEEMASGKYKTLADLHKVRPELRLKMFSRQLASSSKGDSYEPAAADLEPSCDSSPAHHLTHHAADSSAATSTPIHSTLPASTRICASTPTAQRAPSRSRTPPAVCGFNRRGTSVGLPTTMKQASAVSEEHRSLEVVPLPMHTDRPNLPSVVHPPQGESSPARALHPPGTAETTAISAGIHDDPQVDGTAVSSSPSSRQAKAAATAHSGAVPACQPPPGWPSPQGSSCSQAQKQVVHVPNGESSPAQASRPLESDVAETTISAGMHDNPQAACSSTSPPPRSCESATQRPASQPIATGMENRSAADTVPERKVYRLRICHPDTGRPVNPGCSEWFEFMNLVGRLHPSLGFHLRSA